MSEMKCENCTYHDDFTGACGNGDSEYHAEFTNDDDECDEWEGKYMCAIKILKGIMFSSLEEKTAINEAIKALENQPKYEKALYEMSKNVQSCYRCKHEENSPDCARNNGFDESICLNGHVDYYKKEAGSEIDK